MGQEAGKNLYDVLTEIVSRYGVLLIIVVLVGGTLSIAWVHSQTVPGEMVTLLGKELYRKRPSDTPAYRSSVRERKVDAKSPVNPLCAGPGLDKPLDCPL